MATSSSGNQSSGAHPTKHAAPTNGWTRRDRPCDACRRRKSRCIIPQDAEACILCQSRAEECTFVQSPQRRKRRRLDVDESSPDATKPRSPDVDSFMRVNPPVNAKPPVDNYALLKGESLLKQTLGLQNRQHGQYLGLTSEYDTRLINLSPFDGRGEYIATPGTLRRVSDQTHFLMKSENQEQVEEEVSNLDAIESIVRPHGKALIDLYFRIIHPSFPVLHKKVFFEKYSRTYREFTPPVLAAVYILALNWWSYSPELVSLPKPDITKLEKLVPKMMSDVLNRPKLSTVQAGLLLLQRPDGDSWALTGQLVAAGQNLGLHLDCSKWRIPEWELSLRKRLGWALFMQDKWGALIHGRPSHIMRDNWAVKPVEVKDFPETAQDDDDEEGSSEVEKGRLLFVHMISLTEILADVLDTFFTLRSYRDLEDYEGNATMVVLDKAKPVQIRLKEWYSMLPACLSPQDTTARKLCSTGYLHLAYFATEVTLHRAIIRFDSSNTDDNLRSITRTAAQMRFVSAIDFVKRLEPVHLQSFWYFASKVNLAIIGTFGSLLWATSGPPEESDFYRSQLAEYRWTLRVSSKSAEFMKFTVGMLDSSAVFQTPPSNTGTPDITPETGTTTGTTAGSQGGTQQSPPGSQANQQALQQHQFDYNMYNMTVPLAGGGYDLTFANTPAGAPGMETHAPLSWGGVTPKTEGFMTELTPEDWSQYDYSFETMQAVGNPPLGRRTIEEYDENVNNFAEF